MADTPGQVEQSKDFGEGQEGLVKRWMAEIKAYEKVFDSWHKAGQEVVERFRLGEEAQINSQVPASYRFNILWSNVHTLQPAVYNRPPQPNITRRHKDKDPVARASAIILERVVEKQLECGGFHEAVECARDDYLLPGRGQVWVRYVPTYGNETRDRIHLQAVRGEDGSVSYTEDGQPYTGDDVLEDDEGPYRESEPYTPVVDEQVEVDYIHWRNFGHTPAPSWKKVRAVWRRELMDRTQLVKRFTAKTKDGKTVGERVNLTKSMPNVSEEATAQFQDVFMRAEVYEIWDSTSGKVYWISPGFTEGPLDQVDDPLGLSEFFPCPPPLYATTTTDSLVPVPDYMEYKTQAREIDTLTFRIHLLTRALKIAGVYDASVGVLKDILNSDENTLIAIDNFAMLAEKGGLPGAMSFMPIKEVAEVLLSLMQTREQMKQDLYELTGISDIVRGASDPKETYGAQRIKGQYAGMRIEARQNKVGRFAASVVKIVAEVVSEHFGEDTIWEASGWAQTDEALALDRRAQRQQAMQQMAPGMVPPEPTSIGTFKVALQMLRTEKIRAYRVAVDTDQMVYEDQQFQMKSRTDFIKAASGFIKESVPAAQQVPQLRPLLGHLLMFGVRSFKSGRAMEVAFEQAMEDLANAQQQGQGGVQNAELAIEKAKDENNKLRIQLEQAKEQAKAQLDQMKIQLDKQEQEFKQRMEMLKFEADQRDRERQFELEVARTRLQQMQLISQAKDNQTKAQLEAVEVAEHLRTNRERLDLDRQAQRDNAEEQRASRRMEAQRNNEGEDNA